VSRDFEDADQGRGRESNELSGILVTTFYFLAQDSPRNGRRVPNTQPILQVHLCMLPERRPCL
jgi:hypothetical protein